MVCAPLLVNKICNKKIPTAGPVSAVGMGLEVSLLCWEYLAVLIFRVVRSQTYIRMMLVVGDVVALYFFHL